MLKILDNEEVYKPSEDSTLLLEAVKYANGNILDLCAGSGIIGLNAAIKSKKVTLVDINKKALSLIKKNAEINNITNYETLKSNLFDKLGKRRFDVIYMNPPYLPGKAKKGDYLDAATLGGKKGYEITIRAIKKLGAHLNRNGCAFIILSTAYDVDKVYKLLESINFKFSVIDTKKFFFEELILIKIYEKRRHSPCK